MILKTSSPCRPGLEHRGAGGRAGLHRAARGAGLRLPGQRGLRLHLLLPRLLRARGLHGGLQRQDLPDGRQTGQPGKRNPGFKNN